MGKFDIMDYCRRLIEALISGFGSSLCYVGLQGSYLRGEATESSDIDVMVILEELSVSDMDLYREIIGKVGDSERSCGFICSRADMKSWNPLEICQLLYTTKDLHGKLSEFVPEWKIEDEVNYVKMSLNNLYHALCHGYIHGSREELKESIEAFYKAAFFILQNTHYIETYRKAAPEFILKKAELAKALKGKDRDILEELLRISGGGEPDFDKSFALLHGWCKEKLAEIS